MHFKFKNNQELFKALEPEIEKSKQYHERNKLTALQLVRPYLRVAECKNVKVDNNDYVALYPDYESQRYTSNPYYLKYILYEIARYFNFASVLSDSWLKNVLLSDFAIDSLAQQLTMAKIGLIEVENDQIYDVFSKSIVPRDPSVHYYNSYDIDPFRKPDPTSNYYKAAELLYQSWGQNQPDHIRMLKLLTYLAFIGYGANLWISLVGPAGVGKSTFQSMLINLVNRDSYQRVNSKDISKTGNFENVSPFTKLLIDKESSLEHRLSAIDLCELKLFIDGDSSRNCTRYAPIKIRLQNRGLKLKETLHVPHFYVERLERLRTSFEKSGDESLLDRFMMIPFGSLQHVNDKEFQDHIYNLTQQNISDLICNQDFLKEVIAIVLHEFTFTNSDDIYHKAFDYKMKFDSELLSYDLDRFFETSEAQQALAQNIVSVEEMYEMYRDFCRLHNSGFTNISYHIFKAHLSNLLESRKDV